MNIYLKAAIRMHKELLEKPESERHGICQHVKGRGPFNVQPSLSKLRYLFCDEGYYYDIWWLGHEDIYTDENQEHRLTILCFASAMREAGDL